MILSVFVEFRSDVAEISVSVIDFTALITFWPRPHTSVCTALLLEAYLRDCFYKIADLPTHLVKLFILLEFMYTTHNE